MGRLPEFSFTTGEHATESDPGLPTVEFVKKARVWPRSDSPEDSGRPPAKPTRFGKYVVHERLGTGGMASVHAADLCGPGGFRRRVALKRLLPHIAAEPELVQLFLDEARLAQHLRHPHIATIYDFGQVSEEYFMAMELVRGPSLRQLVRHCMVTVGLIPYPIVIHIISQIADALAYAHDVTDDSGRPLGIVHRDVSPANIVLSSGGIAKLIDFGVAKSISSHTSVGIIKGKLAYVAPEYLEGQLDRRADLWGLGVVMWELLTNERLFGGDDVDVVQQVKDHPIHPPSRYNPDVPPELDAIVMTALERDPAKRWQNGGAMRAALVALGRNLGNAPSTGDVAEWVEWAFAQASPESRSSSQPGETFALPLPPRTARGSTPPGPAAVVAAQAAALAHGKASSGSIPSLVPRRSRLRSLTQMLRLTRDQPRIGASYLARSHAAQRKARWTAIVVAGVAAGVASAAVLSQLM